MCRVFDRVLDGDGLDRLQSLLRSLAPRWSRGLRVWRSSRDQRSVDVTVDGDLANAVLVAAGRRGETHRELVQVEGAPEGRLDRFFGSAELRGSGPELIVVVSVDQLVASPLGQAVTLGNQVSLQVRRPEVEREDAHRWVKRVFDEFCTELRPVWACAGSPDEYWAKVMSDRPPVRAVGRDFARFLPGVFWLNCFGERYSILFGRDRLRATPGARDVADDGCVVVEIEGGPYGWDDQQYRAMEHAVRSWIGADFFFDKSAPDRAGRAPSWS